MDEKMDYQSATAPLDLSGEPKFSAEEIAQHDYSSKEWDVDYREAHIWGFDSSLAIFLDKGLTGIMGHGYTYPPDGIKRARDVFRAYATSGDEYDVNKSYLENEPFQNMNSDEYAELMWAFDWLKENFTALWT